MRSRRALTLLWSLAFVGLSTPSLRGEEELRITNWAAPPYWAPLSGTGQGDEANEARTLQSGIHPLAVGTPPLAFVAVPPCRVADTRGNGFLGAFGPPAIPTGSRRDFPIGGQCGIPSNAQAVSFNFTAATAQGTGELWIYAEGAGQPVGSTLSYVAGQPIANAAVVTLGSGEGITLFPLAAADTDILIDVNGYYAQQTVVGTLNTLSGAVTLAAGDNVAITPSGNALTIAATTAGGPPSGPAGGDLAGSYPSPTIATGAVTAAKLADSAVTGAKLANNTAVRSINGAAQDLVTMQGSGNVSVNTAGSTITIARPSGSFVFGEPDDTTLIGAGYSEVATGGVDYWKATSTSGAVPTARSLHTAVWTGSRMVVWGGQGTAGDTNTGGLYDPIANSWTATSMSGAVPTARAAHTAIWTGSRMIVWGGNGFDGLPLNTGGLLDPVGNSWVATSTSGAVPSGREHHTAVWTGSRMIVWGGADAADNRLNTGGLYDPATNSWAATSTSGAVPSARIGHTAVWTGSRMIVWGGEESTGDIGDIVNTGGLYDPVGNSWMATSTASDVPASRAFHTAVWTGSRMIVWGGADSASTLRTAGGLYDPVGNSWAATSTSGDAPSGRIDHTAVWTGSRMIVWGGYGGRGSYANSGGLYDPAANSWTATSTTGAVPSGRSSHTGVWTGSRMIVWGGVDKITGRLTTGGQWQQVSLYRKN